MLVEERERRIIDLVSENSSVTVAELSKALGVSAVTIRKTLNTLHQQGRLLRTHGGAISKSLIPEHPEQLKETQQVDEKKSIAKMACSLISDGCVILLDAGSSTKAIAELIKTEKKRNITVVTNSHTIVNTLIDSDVDIILCGGQFRHQILSCVGPLAENALRSLWVDIAFIGCNSFDLAQGAMTPNIQEAHIKRVMMEQATTSILLADHSKYGKTAMAKIANLEDFSSVITDSTISKEFIMAAKSKKINHLVAPDLY